VYVSEYRHLKRTVLHGFSQHHPPPHPVEEGCSIPPQYIFNATPKGAFDSYFSSVSRYSDSLRAARSGDRIQVKAKISAPVQTGLGVYPASCTMGTGSLSQGQSDQDVALTAHPHLAPRIKKEYSYTSTPCLGVHGLFEGELCLYRYVVHYARKEKP
jgi:hypothetical protein